MFLVILNLLFVFWYFWLCFCCQYVFYFIQSNFWRLFTVLCYTVFSFELSFPIFIKKCTFSNLLIFFAFFLDIATRIFLKIILVGDLCNIFSIYQGSKVRKKKIKVVRSNSSLTKNIVIMFVCTRQWVFWYHWFESAGEYFLIFFLNVYIVIVQRESMLNSHNSQSNSIPLYWMQQNLSHSSITSIQSSFLYF